MHIVSAYIYRSLALRNICKNKLTLFHYQGLNLVNTLFLGSVLAIQLPDFHLHLFYVETFWRKQWEYDALKYLSQRTYALISQHGYSLWNCGAVQFIARKLSCKNRVFLGVFIIQIFSAHAFFTWANSRISSQYYRSIPLTIKAKIISPFFTIKV
jgi:hypothetical protein